MSKLLTIFLLIVTGPSWIGCATIMSGKSQTITLQTNPPGARCELTREGLLIGTVENTPGTVTIHKTKHDINVSCNKQGFGESKEYAKSGIEGPTYGNILLGVGGLIGWGIDSAAGADNKYPDVVTVTLSPESAAVPDSANNSSLLTTQTNETKHKLEQLKELKDGGVISEKEYQQKRADLLRQL